MSEKAFLILEQPTKCNSMECPCNYDEIYCTAAERDVDMANNTIPDWCPIKPKPDRKILFGSDISLLDFGTGYNQCLDELFGTEDGEK